MSKNDFESRRYFSFNALIACQTGWSLLPMSPSDYRPAIFVVTLVMSLLALHGKILFSRKRVLIIWASGIISSLIIILILSNQFARVFLYAICLLVFYSLLHDEIKPDHQVAKKADEGS